MGQGGIGPVLEVVEYRVYGTAEMPEREALRVSILE